jgi:hypothetical protein
MDWVSFTAGSLMGALLTAMASVAIHYIGDALLGCRDSHDATPGQDDGLRYSRTAPCRSYGRDDEYDF